MECTYRAGYAFSSVSDIENAKEYMSDELYSCPAVREYFTDFVRQIIKYKASANIESFTISNKALSFKNGDVLRVDVSIVYEVTSQYDTSFPEKVRSGLYNGDSFYGFSFYVINSDDSYKITAWSEYSYDFTKLTLFTSEGVEVLQNAVEPDNSNMYEFN